MSSTTMDATENMTIGEAECVVPFCFRKQDVSVCLTASFPMFPLCAEDEIKALNGKVEKAEKKVEDLELKDLKEEGKERDEWREDLTAARKELEQLRDEKKQLRDLLLKRQAPQGVC
jgi:peptidoglycan hydrolase CwlO-like protein